jgi:integrase/recombinase XerD
MSREPVPAEARRAYRLEQFRDFLSFERGLSERSLQAYGGDSLRFVEYALRHGVTTPSDVSYELLRNFVAALVDEGYAPSTVSRRISALRTYFSFLLEEGVTSEDPTERLESPRQDRTLPDVLSYGEIESLFRSVTVTDAYGFRDRAMLEVMYGSGLRVSEVTGLCTRDLHLKEGLVQVFGKGSKERLVPLGAGARRSLERYLRELRPRLDRGGSDGRVFVNRNGRPLSRMGVWKILRKNHASHSASQLCHSPPGGRGRPGSRPGNAGARRHLDNRDLYARGPNVLERGASLVSPPRLRTYG